MNKLIQFRFLGANMTRPMGRIVAFAPEPGGFEGPVGEIARKIEDLGNDVWWIHRNGTDQPIDKVGQEKIDKIDRGAFDWRKLLNGARWLITSGPTLISSEDEQAVWSAALTFSELEGTLNALVLSSNDTSFIPIWTKIIPRIRQFHIIGLTSEEIRKISAHEEWSTPNNKREYIETLERIQRKTLIPHLVARENRNGGWSADAHSYGICETENSGEGHMGNWLGKFLHGLIKHGHTKETAVKSLEYAKDND